MNLNVLVIGHSWVRDLDRFWSEGSTPYQVVHEDCSLNIQTYARPGGTYPDLIRHFGDFEPSLSQAPDVVVLLLGSNDIKVHVPISNIRDQAVTLFKKIKEVTPNSKLYIIEIEDRYLDRENRHGTPDKDEYRRLSRYLNKNLRKAPYKDGVLVVRGGLLSNDSLYKRDGIHLNLAGLRAYASWLERSVVQLFGKQ